MTNQQPMQPWDHDPSHGETSQDEEARDIIRGQVAETLSRHAGGLGIFATDLTQEVSDALSDEETGAATATQGEISREVTRMLGAGIRMAPNRRLFPER